MIEQDHVQLDDNRPSSGRLKTRSHCKFAPQLGKKRKVLRLLARQQMPCALSILTVWMPVSGLVLAALMNSDWRFRAARAESHLGTGYYLTTLDQVGLMVTCLPYSCTEIVWS
jgi:hypothetical protein